MAGPATEYWREYHNDNVAALYNAAGTRAFAMKVREFTAELRAALESEMGLSREQRERMNTLMKFVPKEEQ